MKRHLEIQDEVVKAVQYSAEVDERTFPKQINVLLKEALEARKLKK